MIIGTAGHVDHGKSSLITALTGRPMDRLAEERRRGITIELGFTSLDLGNGRRASVVDVPGHEDFIRTMVAGASGMDAAMLVVAADDGIMPQTREHLAVMEQLGVAFIVPVISRTDLVAPDWLELVTGELAQWLSGSPLSVLPPIPVSARTGRGLDQLRAALAELLDLVPPRDPDDLFRMPVDRAFNVAGTGVVVTGTTWSGTIRVGDAIELHPGPVEARVRRIESHAEVATRTLPGSRTALALGGISLSDVGRGSVLVQPGAGWTPTARIVARVALGRDASVPVKLRDVRLSLGTADIIAHAPAGERALAPGEARLVALRLDRHVVARGGDRFVLRQASSGRVIGGGAVLDPLPPARGATRRTADRSLSALAQVRRWGLTVADATIAGGVAPATAGAALERDGLVPVGEHWLPPARVGDLEASAVGMIAAWHAASPMERGMPLATLLARVAAPPGVGHGLLERLAREGRVALREGRFSMQGFTAPRAAPSELERLLAEVQRDGLAPRKVSELPGDPATRDRLLRALVSGRQIVALERDRFVGTEALEGFRQVLERLGDLEITPAAIRDATGLSRKHLIPLLEWADRAGVTIRRGGSRVLARPA